jgi:hypothetical protein
MTWMAGLRADVEPMPGSESKTFQLVTPQSATIFDSSNSTPIEIIKGRPQDTPEPAPPAESPKSSQANSNESAKEPTFIIGSASERRNTRRSSSLPSLESLIGGGSESSDEKQVDDTAPARNRNVKRDPYFEKLLEEAAEKLREQERIEQAQQVEEARLAAEKAKLEYEKAKLEQERLAELKKLEEKRLAEERQREADRLAEEKRIEEERLAEEKRIEAVRLEKERIAEAARREAAAQAEAQARILALPAKLLNVPAPEVQEFVPIPRVVNRTKIITKPVSDWLVMKDGESSILGRIQLEKLLSRARLEVAAGDMLMAHTFAEAAAEVEIPVKLFIEKPKLILAEIEYVTSRRLAKAVNKLVTYDEDAPKEIEPDSFAKQMQKNPRGFRALSGNSLSIKPPKENSSGDLLRLPTQQAKLRMAQLPEVFQDTGYGRGWGSLSYSWDAPAVKYSPLYFEQPELERYGNEYCLGMQPLVSGLAFFLSVPTLPYQMGIEGNSICAEVYDLGYDRPGDCVPYSIHALPFSWTGVATQAAATTGLVFIWP